jgi:hypothetical protein
MKKIFNIAVVYFSVLIILLTTACSKTQTPLEKSDFTQLTSNKELCAFLVEVSECKEKIETISIGRTTQGKDIPAVLISNGQYGTDTSKVKVLIFAQQHGNEQSGKEGALLLIKEFAKGSLHYLLEKIDLLIVPQVNPDGSDADKRRNGMDIDLNRNHLILTAPETQALHTLFDKYLPEVTLDVHEYYPYSKNWMDFGAIKNFDEQFGGLTNINTSSEIRECFKHSFMPFINDYLTERDFTFQEYIISGPPTVRRIRHSTFDINDGRQSFGSFGTFSLILEGKNGRNSMENIRHRAQGQLAGMKGLLQFIYENCGQVKQLVTEARVNCERGQTGTKIALHMKHVANGEDLTLTLLSQTSNKDTLVTTKDYFPIVNSIYSVEKPLGYLIPKKMTDLVEWTERHNLKSAIDVKEEDYKIIRYLIAAIDSIDFEGGIVVNPLLEEKDVTENVNLSEYICIPIRQLKGNFIVQALEPKSMIGLSTYKDFEYMIRKKRPFPILKIISNVEK